MEAMLIDHADAVLGRGWMLQMGAWRTSRVHSVFLMLGSSHSYQRALHCFALLRERRDAIRDH